jgi:hypothetical protein
MAKISTLNALLLLSLSVFVPVSARCDDHPPGKYILAIAQLHSAKYLIAPSEEVGGPFEGEIYFGGVYGAKVKVTRLISGNFDVEPKYMRVISNSPKWLNASTPKLLFIRKYPKFGYRIDRWYEITEQQSRNICLLEADAKTLVSDAMFTVPDGHGKLCEHTPDQVQN